MILSNTATLIVVSFFSSILLYYIIIIVHLRRNMLWLSSIIICALIFGGRGRVTDAFIISPTLKQIHVQSALNLKNGDDDIPTQTYDGISMMNDCKTTRRRVLSSSIAVLVGGATSSLLKPTSAHATATITATKKEISKTLCDPSVSTWTKKYDSGDMPRTVHILGTAHISSASADLGMYTLCLMI